MSSGRLSLALERGIVSLPDDATSTIFVAGATVESDLSAFDPDRTTLLARFADAGETLGFATTKHPDSAQTSVVLVPRSRQAQRAYIRLAHSLTPDTPIIVDGPKTHGIDALYRELRKRADVSEAWSKAHGKVFTVSKGDFSDWPDIAPAQDADGWWRAPGVFSETGIDKASAFLAENLPDLKGSVIDLGAGWGFLSHQMLKRGDVTALSLVENDRFALEAAELNVPDTRATFLWQDALTYTPPAPVDHVVTNPPFHAGRKADPKLGQAFIEAAARMLKPKGQLWLVANRHLPYEGTLKDAFRTTELFAETPSFKIFHATSPKRRKA